MSALGFMLGAGLIDTRRDDGECVMAAIDPSGRPSCVCRQFRVSARMVPTCNQKV